MKKLVLFSIIVFLFQSCGNGTEQKTAEKTQQITKIAAQDSIAVFKTDLLKNISIKNFPITDSTNFDNFEKIGIPDNGFLKQIKFETQKEDIKNPKINYTIPFSKNFTSLVVTYQRGEHELFTTLITVNKKNQIIDILDIAYDEIAESAFQKTSKIDKDKIAVTEWNWMSGEPVTETQIYILQSNGKFKMINLLQENEK